MSKVKQFTLSPSLCRASKKCLKTLLPSDCLYSLAAAIYDKSRKTKQYTHRELLREATKKAMIAVKSMRALEEQYYG